jgi:hypothetical protein
MLIMMNDVSVIVPLQDLHEPYIKMKADEVCNIAKNAFRKCVFSKLEWSVAMPQVRTRTFLASLYLYLLVRSCA